PRSSTRQRRGCTRARARLPHAARPYSPHVEPREGRPLLHAIPRVASRSAEDSTSGPVHVPRPVPLRPPRPCRPASPRRASARTGAEIPAPLARIGYDGPRAPDVATLRALHEAHLHAVPFENLDIHIGRPIALDQAALFRKIVGERRGGFCYELNGLFAALLS